jgi:predicted choloylglycine hydrolase
LPNVNSNLNQQSFTRKQIATDHYQVNNCWLKKNKYGIWEMYIEGEEYERGIIYGVLGKELIQKQEECFVDQINELVPNKVYQTALKYFVAWFNRDIYKYIPLENQMEIYGISLSFSDKFDYIGPKYHRILNYHAAHDIGHALNDYSMVGCTSFAVTKEFSADSNLLIGRNFDFSLGDDFARDKLLVFVNPKKGYKYASYSWAGLTGVVSGMNEKGLTVTLNASKSDIPFASKEPISILAREILQYAKNVNEAIAIAKQRETFVSESLLIGSAEDDQAVIIEKSQQKIDVYRGTKNKLICSNHYQGELFMHDSINLKNISNSDSKYRFDKVNELLQSGAPLTAGTAVEILRNKEGLGGKNIGLGNQKSVNQLIAHHSIVFKPNERKMWISTPPYQMGEFICYDLNEFFKSSGKYRIDSLNIKEDNFIHSIQYKRYESCKIIRQKLKKFVLFNIPFYLDSLSEKYLIKSNPESYATYMELGDYYKKTDNYLKAKNYYKKSLSLEVASKNEIQIIEKNFLECEKKLPK